MPITFDEVSAEIVPPEADRQADLPRPAAPAAEPDAVEPVRRALALLAERAARVVAD